MSTAIATPAIVGPIMLLISKRLELHATALAKSFAGIRAEQKARTRAQCDAICAALADGEKREIANLTHAVRQHPAWRDVADAKRYQTMVDRLNMLRDQNRIEDDRKPGPRGSVFRLVRLKKPTV